MIKLSTQNFKEFETSVLALASAQFPEEPHGYDVSPAFLTHEEWLTLDGVDGGVYGEDYSFVPPPPPGPVPNTAVAQANWQQANKLYLSYRSGIQVVKNFITTTVDPLQLRVLDEGNHGWHMTASEMMRLLRARFGRLSATDIEVARAVLDVPYASNKDMRLFIANMRQTHTLLATNGYVVNNYDQFQSLYLAIARSGMFAHALSSFFTVNPYVDDQTFVALSAVIIAASDNLRSTTVRMQALSIAATGAEGGSTAGAEGVANLVSNREQSVKYHGPQPANPKQRIVIHTQYLCIRHGWCNSEHACTEPAPEKKKK